MDQRDADSDRGFPVDGVSARAARLAAELRGQARLIAAAQARELRLVAELAAEVAAAARADLPEGPRVPGQPFDEEMIADAVDAELAAVLGVSETWAAHLSLLAGRLCQTLPDTLAALQAGRLDLIRARRLADATADLPVEVARRVESQLLAGCGDAPWAGPSPRAWRARIERAIVRLAPDYVRERRARALAEREVQAWAVADGTGVLRITADQPDVAMADEVISDLALQWPDVDPADPEGGKLAMSQRRVDSLMDLFRRIRDGRDLPSLPVRREHDIALVVARRQVGLGAATTVLLTTGTGVLAGTVRLPAPPGGAWTPQALRAAIHRRLERDGPVPPDSDRYPPTARQAAFVQARNPRCTAYDCPRASSRCDLDHDRPWPRGPTSVHNLAPRHRRHHEAKTRGLVHTQLRPDGTVTTTMLTGLTVTTRPEPLPGYGPGERRPMPLDPGIPDNAAA